MTYATSTPINAPRKYNTIKTDAPDYLLVILSYYSSKSDGPCLVCLPSITLPRTSHAHAPAGQARVDFGFATPSRPSCRVTTSRSRPHHAARREISESGRARDHLRTVRQRPPARLTVPIPPVVPADICGIRVGRCHRDAAAGGATYSTLRAVAILGPDALAAATAPPAQPPPLGRYPMGEVHGHHLHAHVSTPWPRLVQTRVIRDYPF